MINTDKYKFFDVPISNCTRLSMVDVSSEHLLLDVGCKLVVGEKSSPCPPTWLSLRGLKCEGLTADESSGLFQNINHYACLSY